MLKSVYNTSYGSKMVSRSEMSCELLSSSSVSWIGSSGSCGTCCCGVGMSVDDEAGVLCVLGCLGDVL